MANHINIARGLTLVYEWEAAAAEPQHVWLMFDASNGERDGLNLAANADAPRVIVRPAMRLWAKDRILDHLAAIADRARDVTPPRSRQ